MQPLKCGIAVDTVAQPAETSGTPKETFKRSPRLDRTIRTPRHVRMIYKICPASAWREAERQGVYRGSADGTHDIPELKP